MKGKSSSTAKTPVKTKMTMAQLQEKLELQEKLIIDLKEDAEKKDLLINKLETKINKLESEIAINKSLQFVRERVSDELRSQLIDLQQYTRRYSVIISGVHKNKNEKEEISDMIKSSIRNNFPRCGQISSNRTAKRKRCPRYYSEVQIS